MLIRILLILSFLVNPLAAATGAGCGPAGAPADSGAHSCCCGDACPNLDADGGSICQCAGDQDRPPPAPSSAERGPHRDLAVLPRPRWMVQVSAAPRILASAPLAAPRPPARSINCLVCVWLT